MKRRTRKLKIYWLTWMKAVIKQCFTRCLTKLTDVYKRY